MSEASEVVQTEEHLIICPHCKYEQVGYVSLNGGKLEAGRYLKLCTFCRKEFVMAVSGDLVIIVSEITQDQP